MKIKIQISVVAPPSVRCGDFLRFIDGRPILSYFPDPIKVRSGPGVLELKNLMVLVYFYFRLIQISCLALVHDALIPMVVLSLLDFKSEAISSLYCHANFSNW
jgi:hypothetical protein